MPGILQAAVIEDMRPPGDRIDLCGLWENYLVAERLKRNHYTGRDAAPYFRRTYTGAEIDYVEESEGALNGYQFKLTHRPGNRPQKTWLEQCPGSTWQVVDRENWLDSVC